MQFNYKKETDSKFVVYVKDHFSEIVMAITLVAFVLTGFYILLSFNTESVRLKVDSVGTLKDGWIIHEIDNGDNTHTITFKNKIPSDAEKGSVIAFKSTDELIYAYIDDQLIYTYGEENSFEKPINLGSHYVILELPSDAAGKHLTIYATYHGKQTQWRQDREFLIEGNDGIILRLIMDDIVSILICFVMISISIFELFKALFLGIRRQPFRSTLFLALFILASSNWLASETVLMQLFFNNLYIKYVITYFSFLSLPCLFPMFAKEKLERFNLPMAFAAVLSWAYACVSMLLFVTLSIGFEKHLYVAHGLMAFVIAVVLACCILDRKNKQLKNLLAGTVILAFFAIVSLFSYHRGYINSLFSAYHFRDFFFAGMISFIIVLLYDSYVQSSKDKKDAALSNFYKQSAYTDLLTKLGSRTAFMEDFTKIDGEKEEYRDITVIMLDLNNLKKINDIMGHATGDELIKSLADSLISTFAKDGKIYRIGGDEFVVLLTDVSKEQIDKYLAELTEAIDSQNNPELSGDTVAIGIASRNKNENTQLNIHELLKKADERMYADKNRKKGASANASDR